MFGVQDRTVSDRAAQGSDGKIILVVEDDDDIREMFIQLLRDAGYQAIGAADGRAGLDLLRRGAARPGLILLDLRMAAMDGWQFHHEQKRDPALAPIPVVIITADVRASTLAGARAHLTKPVQFQSLLDTIARNAL